VSGFSRQLDDQLEHHASAAFVSRRRWNIYLSAADSPMWARLADRRRLDGQGDERWPRCSGR